MALVDDGDPATNSGMMDPGALEGRHRAEWLMVEPYRCATDMAEVMAKREIDKLCHGLFGV